MCQTAVDFGKHGKNIDTLKFNYYKEFVKEKKDTRNLNPETYEDDQILLLLKQNLDSNNLKENFEKEDWKISIILDY